MNRPPPSSKSTFVEYHQLIGEKSQLHVEDSPKRAREEVRQFYGAVSESEIVDCLVSIGGTWQKRGHQSLLGGVYVIEYQMGKVLDYKVCCKFCHDCNWNKDADFLAWKESHESKYECNFDGNSGSMDPVGLVQLFKHTLDYKLHYKYFVSDGDSSTLASLMKEKLYGEDCEIIKEDCIGHTQKRMGSALRRLVLEYKGKFLSDSKKISGTGRLTKKVIDELQNYYGMGIRSNVGDLHGIMMALQATLHHMTSTDDQPFHHKCPEGENCWCSYNKAKAHNELDEYKQGFDAIPQAIVQLLKPIYNQLGSRLLLSKCLLGYTQNANESLHSTKCGDSALNTCFLDLC